MTRSGRRRNGARARSGLRRAHRWIGSGVVAFAVLLAVTGLALNHGDGLELDRHYVDWPWLLDAYGIESPPLAASFAAAGHRASLLGEHLYFDETRVAEGVAALTGMVALESLLLVTTDRSALLLTADGQLAEAIDLDIDLPAPVARLGTAGGRPVLLSAGATFRSDPGVTVFAPWETAQGDAIRWSTPSSPGPDELAALQQAYRGHGLTLERVLLDLHSGRILARAGTFVMDVVAILMIVLSVTGLFLVLRRGPRETGRRR